MEKDLAKVVQTVHDTLIANSCYSSLRKSASELEKLSKDINVLNNTLEDSNISSTKLSKSLNRITLAAVLISLVALGLQVYKLFFTTC